MRRTADRRSGKALIASYQAFQLLLYRSLHLWIGNASSKGGAITKMTGLTPAYSLLEGADGAASVTWAVELPDDGPTGGFLRNGCALPW